MRTASVALLAFVALGPLGAVGNVRAQGPPQIPATYYGTLTIDGAPAPEGAFVRAYIDGRDCTQTDAKGAVIEEGVARYVITVVHHTQVAGCGLEGAAVLFEVDGVEASPSVKWVAGPQEVNLSAGASVSPESATTPTPIAPGPSNPPSQADEDDSSMQWWLAALGVALAAVGAAAGLILWRKRPGKG